MLARSIRRISQLRTQCSILKFRELNSPVTTAAKSVLPQKRESSSSITETDRKIYLLVSQEKSEAERLVKQAQTIIQVKGGYFDAPVHDQLVKGIKVLDPGCGPGAWVLGMSKQYPQSIFCGVDISPVFEAASWPSNCQFTRHNLLAPMPFSDNSFDFIHQQFLTAAIPQKSWPKLVYELLRVLRPGGWIELTEISSELLRETQVYRLNLALVKDGGIERGIRYSVGRELEGHLIGSGTVNVDAKLMLFPVGHGGPIGAFW
ncbi:S-adenosyl-L-methionine-dependent methyltransferase, partial [Fennellomyces sp. T-0311]